MEIVRGVCCIPFLPVKLDGTAYLTVVLPQLLLFFVSRLDYGLCSCALDADLPHANAQTSIKQLEIVDLCVALGFS